METVEGAEVDVVDGVDRTYGPSVHYPKRKAAVVVVVEVLDETGKHKKEEREEKEREGGTYLFRQCAQVKAPVTGSRSSSQSSSGSS